MEFLAADGEAIRSTKVGRLIPIASILQQTTFASNRLEVSTHRHQTTQQGLPSTTKLRVDYHDTVRKNATECDDLRKHEFTLKCCEFKTSEFSACPCERDHIRKVTGSSPVTPIETHHR
jgi:hypothetical protein